MKSIDLENIATSIRKTIEVLQRNEIKVLPGMKGFVGELLVVSKLYSLEGVNPDDVKYLGARNRYDVIIKGKKCMHARLELSSIRFFHRGFYFPFKNYILCEWGGLAMLSIRFQLEGELAQIYKLLRKAHSNGFSETLNAEGIRCFGSTIEIPLSEEDYHQIRSIIRESELGYSSVEEFVQEIFTDMLTFAWKAFGYELQERVSAYIT